MAGAVGHHAAGLERRLQEGGLVLLDGGTGTELERRGVPMDGVVWSATANASHPEVVRAVHEDYLRAGSEVLITNTFSTGLHQLEHAGLGERFEELNRRAVALALEARAAGEGDRPVLVAGSISPVFFGTEATCSVARAEAGFERQAALLADAGVDLIVLEMLWDLDYSAAAVRAAVATGLPVWLGFCARLEGGEVLLFSQKFRGTLASALEAILPLGGSVVTIMHTETREVAAALDVVRAHWRGPIGAYGHSGRFVMPHWQFNDVISPSDYLNQASKWVEQGARLVGGCCGIGPAHIALLRERLQPPAI